jgi:hypothetical protein
MEDRQFTVVDLRRMMEHARAVRPDILEGRYVVDARHAGGAWEVIVEPDEARSLLVVSTAYPVDRVDA